MDLVVFLLCRREEALAKQAVKSGRRIGRQAHIKATADSPVLHIMKETPPAIQYILVESLGGVGYMLLRTGSGIYESYRSSYAYENTTGWA